MEHSGPVAARPKSVHEEEEKHADNEDLSDHMSSFSEIPVVQSPASKILVDEHTEWRCFISSDNPEQEKDNLRGESRSYSS